MKRILALVLGLIMVCSLAGCGGDAAGGGNGGTGASNGGTSAAGTGEFVYVPEWHMLATDMESISISDMTFLNGRCYFLQRQFSIIDDELEDMKQQVCYYENGSYDDCKSLIEDYNRDDIEEGFVCYIEKMFVASDGTIYFIEMISPAQDMEAVEAAEIDWEKYYAEMMKKTRYYLTRLNSDGTVANSVDITQMLGSDEGFYGVSNGGVGTNGTVYMSTMTEKGSMLMAVNAEGQIVAQETFQGYIDRFCILANGNLAMIMDNELVIMDENCKVVGKDFKNLPKDAYFSLIQNGLNGTILLSDGMTLYEYNPDTQECSTVLEWLDCEVKGDYIDSIVPLEDGNYLASYADWSSEQQSLLLLKKTDASLVTRKEVIVLGCFGVGDLTQEQVIAFNKTSDKYKIVINDYSEKVDWSVEDAGKAYSDAIEQFNYDLITGKGPDIICMNEMTNPDLLIEKGVIEDLYPYLEKSETYSKEDFIPGILKAYESNGALYTLPSAFSMEFLAGKTAFIGDRDKWTVEDLVQILEQNPGMDLFPNICRGDMLALCMYDMDQYINWQTGECNFTGDDFKKILELDKMSGAEEYIEYEAEPKVLLENRALLYRCYAYDFTSVPTMRAIYKEEPFTVIGYPTGSGKGVKINSSYRYCINSSSQYKEAAWQFIELSLGDNYQLNFMNDGLPTKQALFDQELKNAPSAMTGLTMGWDDMQMEIGGFTEEDAKIMKDMLARVDGSIYYDAEIMDIIKEEAAPYYDGQKSVDEVCDIIQSRVSMYVNELR